MTKPSVRQLRVVLVVDEFDDAVTYYRETLGLVESAAMAGPAGARVVILEAGRATLELANREQAAYIAAVETGGRTGPPVRLAFEVDDAGAAVNTLGDAGVRLIAPVIRTPWGSLNARLEGPAGVPVTVFQEPGRISADGDQVEAPVGASFASFGGEAGLLTYCVDLAGRHGATGQLPFAAVVVRDGMVIGSGVNAALLEHDPSAHGEVVAIRDAARRAASADLRGAAVYSSCEPCAICRTVAAAAGVREIVFAASKESVPLAIDPTPDATARLIDAVTALLPGIARQGDSGLSSEELSAPFRFFLEAADRRRT